MRQNLAPSIKQALRKQRAAASRLRKIVREAQASCPHDRVLHVDWRPGEWLGASPGMRLCVRCGYEEHCAYGKDDYWPNVTKGPCSMETDYSRKPVLISDFVKKVSSSALIRCRPC